MAYSFTKIVFPNDTFTQALGIDNNDDIVGFHGQTTNLGYRLTLPASFTPVQPPGATQTQVVGINNDKTAVGFYVDAKNITHGFISRSNGTITTQDEPGTAFNQLLAVNDTEEKVGYSSLDPAGQVNQLAYSVDIKGSYTLLDNAQHTLFLPNNFNSQATGVDNAGDIVGFYLPTATTSNGFLLKAGAKTPITLQFPGATFTQALGINNHGEVTGFYNDAAGNSHGFVWSHDNWTKVDVPNATATVVNSINDSGHAVGFDTVGAETDGFMVALPVAQLTDNTTNDNWEQSLNVYTGPLTYLTSEFVDVTPDKLNMTTKAANVFLHSGPGDDALQVTSGQNVLDGGTGSNFLTNGTGPDTDFVDARGATRDIWSTMNNFHSGNSATVFGVTAQDFKSWVDGQGVNGFTGLTTHIPLANGTIASLTLVGFTTNDLKNGRLTTSFGTDPASGSNYLLVHAT